MESVAQVHPAMTNHIVMMQPEFGFKNRELAELAAVAVENNAKVMNDEQTAGFTRIFGYPPLNICPPLHHGCRLSPSQ